MNNLLIFQVILPLVINLISGILLSKFDRHRKAILFTTLIVLFSCLYFGAYLQTPELIAVPDLQGQWKDQATILGKKMGLEVIVKDGSYGDRQDKVQRQSLAPGSLVLMNTKIEIYVCKGYVTGDPLYNY
jgi:beta-lactam-binding protein with PASTA domain